jgi:hypothetical protein
MSRRRASGLAALLCALAATGAAAQEHAEQHSEVLKMATPSGHVALEQGALVNRGDAAAVHCEIIDPIYRYLGDLPPGASVEVALSVPFTVQYLTPAGLAKWRRVTQPFTPEVDRPLPDVGLLIDCELRGLTLGVIVEAREPIANVAIEILRELPVRIADERVRYATSPVAVAGQSVVTGPQASFPLLLLEDRPLYSVPISVRFDYQGVRHAQLLFYGFAKEQLD